VESSVVTSERNLRGSNDKLAAAAHLVIARLPPDDLGATKLNKILWFADCEFYRRHGRSLTGETEYIRRENGPCPNRMGEVIARLKIAGAIAERSQPIANYSRREFTPLSEPDVSSFTPEEVDILLSVALEIAPLSAKRASDISHDDLWKATPPNGRMSVEAGSVRIMPSTPEAHAWARALFAVE
jgi:hypothetical protein